VKRGRPAERDERGGRTQPERGDKGGAAGPHDRTFNRRSGDHARKPKAESREPRAESREPRAESRKPKAESRKPTIRYIIGARHAFDCGSARGHYRHRRRVAVRSRPGAV